MGNYETIVHNYWADREKFRTEEFAILEREATALANEKYSVDDILAVARSGRAMTAEQALAVLTQDKIQEQKETPHTDY